ncbi:MAG: hypothetical protein QHI48_12255 [Bacteroidota bacterium]|nr:hypothetical protein [Bacteroidota bacterium]
MFFFPAQTYSQRVGDGSRLRKIFDDDESKFTNVGSIRLTITNYGTLGHGFNRWPQQPNCEYPAGSGIEHLFEGGLWIGGFRGGRGPFVSTGAVDVSSVRDIAAGFEFTNAPGALTIERSSLPDSRYYSSDAVSHQDFVALFTDSNTVIPGTSTKIPEHENPLGVVVRMESYAWNFSFAENFVILRYRITNASGTTLDSLYVGLWIDMVVRNTNMSPPRGSAFFARGGNGYIDSMCTAYEFDVDGDPGFTDSYIGLSLLGTTPTSLQGGGSRLPVVFNTWQFRNTTDPVFFSPANDRERYEKMCIPLSPLEIPGLRSPSNRSVLVSTGPFRNLQPGQDCEAVFAVICAKKYGNDTTADDTENAKKNLHRAWFFARQAYDGEDKNRNGVLDPGEDLDGDGRLTRYVLPAPPIPPSVRVIPSDRKVTVYWDDISESSIDPISGKKDFEGYRVYRTNAGADLDQTRTLADQFILIGEFDRNDDVFFANTGFGAIRLKERIRFEGDAHMYTYAFEIPNQLNGWQYVYTVTAFDTGDPENSVESLESSKLHNIRRVVPGTTAQAGMSREPFVYPNPYYAHALWDGGTERQRKIHFANLPRRAEIRIYTLAGDLVRSMHHDASTYNGGDIGWYTRYADGTQILSGGEHAWDLITDNDQAVATGLYLFTVKDLDTGDVKRGKFAIIK